MANLGSFGANVSPDAMQAVRAAISRRQEGGNVPALNQQTGASPTAAPLPPEAVGGIPAAEGAMAPPAAGPMENPEAKLILSAMKERLKALSDIQLGVPA